MARTKTATRQRASPKRSQLTPVSKESFATSPQTPTTPDTDVALNGTASLTLASSEDNSLSPSPSLSVPASPSASASPVSKLKSRRKAKTQRTPFLASDIVGNKSRRIGIQEAGKPKKTIMTYCIDCVRPHLWVYCDGTKELKTHLCEFHEQEPNPRHSTKHYSRIRKLLDHLFQHEKKGGKVSDRPFTKPKLKHRLGCGHDKKTLDGDFDEKEMAAMKQMRRIEKRMAREEGNDDEGDNDRRGIVSGC